MRRTFLIFMFLILLGSGISQTCFAGEHPLQKPAAPRNVKAASYDYHKIRISWDKSDEASGYAVYRSASRDGKFKQVYITNDPDKNWYINTNRSAGKRYYYKVKVFSEKDGKTKHSKNSETVSAYARPRKVRDLIIETAGFMGNTFVLRWTPVKGADGYQVSMCEVLSETQFVESEKKSIWKNSGIFYESFAEIKIPDTSKCYKIKVRAFRMKDGRKVYGYYSEPDSYAFTWAPEDLKKAGEEILKGKWPEVCLEEKWSDGEQKTPYNGTVWYALWPLRCSRYEPWDAVIKKLSEKIETAMELSGGGLNGICFYLSPESSKNWVELYMLC